jgi:hypothetical protein
MLTSPAFTLLWGPKIVDETNAKTAAVHAKLWGEPTPALVRVVPDSFGHAETRKIQAYAAMLCPGVGIPDVDGHLSKKRRTS